MAKKKPAPKKPANGGTGVKKFKGLPEHYLNEFILIGNGKLDPETILFSRKYTKAEITVKARTYIKRKLKESKEEKGTSDVCPQLNGDTVRAHVRSLWAKDWVIKIERSRATRSDDTFDDGDPDPDPDYRISVGERQDTTAAMAWFMIDSLPPDYDRLVPQEVMELAGSYVPIDPED